MASKVSVRAFLKKYMAVLTNEQFHRMENITLGITKTLTFSSPELSELNQKLDKLKVSKDLHKFPKEKNKIRSSINGKGDNNSPITVYENNISIGYPAIQSYERLMDMYRGLKRYDDEIRVLNRGLEVYSKKNEFPNPLIKWSERLLKVMKLQNEGL